MSNKSKQLVGKKIVDNYGRSGVIAEVYPTGLEGPEEWTSSWIKDQEDKRVREHHTPKSIWVLSYVDGGGTCHAPLALCKIIS